MDKQTKDIIIGAGVLAVAYFGIINPLLKKLGLKKTAEELATEKRKQAQLEQQVQSVAKDQKPTKSVEEWQVIADQIYEDLKYSAISDNKADAAYQVTRVKNDADVWLLFKYFAKRREYLFGIPSGSLMNLSQFIISNLSQGVIDKINDNYRRKNIKFRF
jgi:hypothetical protein